MGRADGRPIEAKVVPPVNVMIEQIWRMAPVWQKTLWECATMVSGVEQVLQASLENEILIRELAKQLNVELPTPNELRRKIMVHRKEFLTKVLEDDSLVEEQKEAIKKEINAIEETLNPKESGESEKGDIAKS